MNENLETPGIIWLPYVFREHTDESLKAYDEFMDDYNEKHKFCPKCGSEDHSTTLVGYILDRSKKDEYKDKNSCVCSDCGDRHIFHDRVETFNK
jgi:transcription elongation factor Elf1